MNDIKISVLTPVYNHSIEHLTPCLESLKKQTTKNIEFILIDNGATDESKISDNSILGAKSVLAKKINEENVVIAGNPAKIIRRNINWSHESLFMTENKNH